MKKRKLSLLHSIIALLLCVSMLVGTTFAWFTDGVTSGKNRIVAGNLDVELEYMDAKGHWHPVEEDTNVFAENTLWEPGHTEVVYLRVSNQGSLALKYQLGVNIAAEAGSVNMEGEAFVLSDYIEFAAVKDQKTLFADRAAARLAAKDPKILSTGYTQDGTIEKGAEAHYVAFVVYMPEDVGNEANYRTGEQPPRIDLGISLLATQATAESDSFGSDYDYAAGFPQVDLPDGGKTDVTVDNGTTAGAVTISGNAVSADVPAGVAVNDGTTALELSVTEMSATGSNITLAENEVLKPLDVHVEGVSASNSTPIAIKLTEFAPKGLNMGNLKLYHVEKGKTNVMTYVAVPTPAHNEFTYDPATGDVTLYLATFSEVAMVADTEKAWEGNFDYSWYTNAVAPVDDESVTEYAIANADQLAAFGAIVGGMNGQTQDSFAGKTVKLISDVNLGDKESENKSDLIFYPIGYYNSTGKYEKTSGGSVTSSVSSFEGTFDGNGHTVKNFYQNTWEMFGDYNDGYSGTPNYYKDAMGLFGYVNGGTVKNLTVDNFSSDGEFTPTGVIAAYADGDSVFENIAITNCNPRVYNTGNGGIIGIAGDTGAVNDDHIKLTNITVDNSNKISALWGSYDVACGGLVGMYRGNVDGSGNATDDTIAFDNCHVSAVIDVYNDVCANYQYYAYRYAGMIIGSVRHNTKNTEGKTIPNMTGISASGCTVNYGDWNDYYYCEFVKNGHPSYSGPNDYKFSRVPNSEIDTTNGKENATCIGHNHTDVEDNQAIYLPFHQLFTGYSWGVSSIGLEAYSGIVTNLDITEGDQEESVVKFASKFTGDFLYRVGNANTVSIGSLFAAAAKKDAEGNDIKDENGNVVYWDINDAGTWVTIEKVDENSNVSGTFTANTDDWTKGTIQFSGTGVVKVTIQDYNFCTPTELKLEVVDAVNATGATSATANNVVLLNDCGFSSLEVSGGYTLYGNGFTMTCGSDSAALDMGYSFVTLNNGTLDNVQIVCPNFDYAVLYKSNMTESGNRTETTDKTRYFNVKSGVMASGNSQILNSRVSGGRAAVNVSGGNVVIDNSRIELGAVASVLVGSANSLTLRDVTLVQKPTASTYDSSKTLMGFSVLLVCNSSGDAAPVTLEGTLVQNAWVDENDKQYVPSAGQSIISNVLTKTDYLHDIDGDGTNESLNLGFAYMPESLTSAVNTTTITDNRTNKDQIPYDYTDVSIANGKTYVYSYKNTKGTDAEIKEEDVYVPDTYGDSISVTYSDAADGLTTKKSYETDGWIYELNVDLDKLSGYALDFSKLSMTVNGVNVSDFTVDGNAKPASPVAVVAGGTTYTLTATVNGKECTALFKVTGTETTKESPSLVASNYEAAVLVGEAGNTFSKDTWHGAAPALEGIQIKYWSVAEKQYKTITLSDYTPTTAGKQNGTNTTWTYSPDNGDFTLTLTGGQVHSSNNVNAMPVVVNSKLYYVAASSNGLVNYGNGARTIPVTYSFKDNNGGTELTFSHTWSIECTDGATAYDYSDFCNGTSKIFTIKSSNGDSCVTPDTLITLADGTQKRIDQVTYADKLLVWDFYEGRYNTANASIVMNHGYGKYEVVKLNFADGTTVKTINGHGFYTAADNKFVILRADNVASYVGQEFIKQDGSGYTTTNLVSYSVYEENTESWSVLTAGHYNCILEGMFTLTPAEVEGSPEYLMPYAIDSNLKYDKAAMNADVQKYGLYTYADFADYMTYQQFQALGLANFKVSVAKGYITWDEIEYLIQLHIAK